VSSGVANPSPPSRSLRSASVPRTDAVSIGELQHHIRRRRPVVLAGFAAEWPALRRWSLDFLQCTHATLPITTARVQAGAVVMDRKKGLLHERMPLGAFIEALRAGAADRYLMSRMHELPETLRCDTPIPQAIQSAPWQSGNLWIGAAGVVSAMHRDLADNLHVQVRGRKRFVLVAPQQSSSLYPNAFFDGVPNGCRIDIELPDFVRFPKLRRVETLLAELDAGDALYIPHRWWHHVRTLELSVSVNFWWATGAQRFLVVAADGFKRLRGISR
jgi:hypothetical protein